MHKNAKNLRRRWIISFIALGALFVSVFAWRFFYANSPNTSNIPSLAIIADYAAQKGPRYAEDRLDFLQLYDYKQIQLQTVWGESTDTAEETDTWPLPNGNTLVITYDQKAEVTKVEVK